MIINVFRYKCTSKTDKRCSFYIDRTAAPKTSNAALSINLNESLIDVSKSLFENVMK